MSQVGLFIAGSRNGLQPAYNKTESFLERCEGVPRWKERWIKCTPKARNKPAASPRGTDWRVWAPLSLAPPPTSCFSHSPNSNSQENKIQSSHPATTGTSHVTHVGNSQGHFGTVKESTRRASVYTGRDRCPQKPEQRLPLLGTQGPRWSEGGTRASHGTWQIPPDCTF